VQKIEELRAVGDPIEARLNEETARQPAIEQLQKQISLCKSFLSNYDDCYAHITEDERDVLRTEVSKTESWLQTELNKQSKLPKHDNPVLTADAIGKTRATLFKCSSPIMTKPKPAPPAAPQPAAEEKKEKEPAQVLYCQHPHSSPLRLMHCHVHTSAHTHPYFSFSPLPTTPVTFDQAKAGDKDEGGDEGKDGAADEKGSEGKEEDKAGAAPTA